MGRLSGIARVTSASPGSLTYAEDGLLTLGAMQTEARQSYRYQETPTGYRVFFADGRFFHDLRPEHGRAHVSHDCAPDLYRGRYRVETADRWWLSWRITGPRKDLVIASLFLRLG
ncbi:hypothetical protein Acid7E03_04920 [Acidisoma sp. 7E03]